MNETARALMQAHLAFIQKQFENTDTVTAEVLGFFDWLRAQNISSIWNSAQVNNLLQKQILATPATRHLMQQIEQHIALALQHPVNTTTTIEDILPVETIDQIALYIASKTEQRQQLIKQIVHNPAYTQLITHIVQQSVKDYLDNSVVARKVPGVGSLMKMGKSVIEKATDSTLDDAIQHYLHKNINKLSMLSEKLINQHFDEQRLYHLQAKLWHSIKKMPLSSVQHYIVTNDLPKTVAMGEHVWNHIRQTSYLQTQVSTAVEAWVERHAAMTFAQAFEDINIDEQLLRNELYELVMPIIQHLIQSQYLLQRAASYLEIFYSSDEVSTILNQ